REPSSGTMIRWNNGTLPSVAGQHQPPAARSGPSTRGPNGSGNGRRRSDVELEPAISASPSRTDHVLRIASQERADILERGFGNPAERLTAVECDVGRHHHIRPPKQHV